MKILQVITDTDRRGAQVFATDLGRAISTMGHEVTTVALRAGTREPRLDLDVLGRTARGVHTLVELRRRMSSVDITIAHGSSTALACALTASRRRPFVYRQISDTRFWARTWSRRTRVACYLRRARGVVALSAGAKADLVDHLGLSPSTIDVVPNGVPGGPFGPASNDGRRDARLRFGLGLETPVVVFIGALVPEKGADQAVRAIGEIDGVHLLVVGDGPQRPELERLAQTVAGGRVDFTGVLDDTSSAYAAADVVVLPSRGGDSMPATLIEAGLCALPTVATPIGSIEDVVLDGVTGLIVPPDDEQALRSAISRLVTDVSTRTMLGGEARRHCLAHFEIDVVADQWIDVLARHARTGHDR